MPLRVCLYISGLGAGGAERQVVHLARELAGRGVKVTLLHAQNDLRQSCYLDTIVQEKKVDIVNAFSPEFFREGIRLSKMHEDFFKNIPAPPLRRMGIIYLAGAFSFLRPDIVHSFIDVNNCTAGCAVVMAGVPGHLASFCSLDPETAQDGTAALTHPLYHYLLAHARPHFEACSRAATEHYARWLGIPLEAISYSPNGIDPTTYLTPVPDARAAIRQELGIPMAAPVLLSLSRFVWAKSPEALLEVFRRVLAARPECHFLLAGVGMAESEEMGELLRKCGSVNHVHLLGVRRDVASLFAAADVFLLPSRVESFPISIMEAMTMKLPVVASTAGGIPDLVRHGLDGFLHEAADVEGMAQSIATLLDDAGLRTRLGRAGKQRVAEEFTLKKLGDRALKQYADILAESAPRA